MSLLKSFKTSVNIKVTEISIPNTASIGDHFDTMHILIHKLAIFVGWIRYGNNSLEIRNGGTSLGSLVVLFTSRNISHGTWLTSTDTVYIRLRGALEQDDKLKFIYAAVDNATEGGEYWNTVTIMALYKSLLEYAICNLCGCYLNPVLENCIYERYGCYLIPFYKIACINIKCVI